MALGRNEGIRTALGAGVVYDLNLIGFKGLRVFAAVPNFTLDTLSLAGALIFHFLGF